MHLLLSLHSFFSLYSQVHISTAFYSAARPLIHSMTSGLKSRNFSSCTFLLRPKRPDRICSILLYCTCFHIRSCTGSDERADHTRLEILCLQGSLDLSSISFGRKADHTKLESICLQGDFDLHSI